MTGRPLQSFCECIHMIWRAWGKTMNLSQTLVLECMPNKAVKLGKPPNHDRQDSPFCPAFSPFDIGLLPV